jgi:DNA-binding transcriptional LysR family regulator
LLRELRDGRLDALVAPAMFGWTELRRLRLGWEPWVVLVGAGHRLARPGAVGASDLDGEPLVVSGHRDGADYDRAVGDLLAGLGVTPVLRRGGPGPALFAAVADGSAVALSTAAGAAGAGVLVRPLEPARRVAFELVWREEAPAPAVSAFIRAAQAGAEPARSRVGPAALAAVA